MDEILMKIRIAAGALNGLQVAATEENTEKLTVIWQMLRQAQEDLRKAAESGTEEKVYADGEEI